jgi:hypothetical protein
VGVTVNNAVNGRENIKQPALNIAQIAGTVDKGQAETAHLDNLAGGKSANGLGSAHVAVHGMDGFARKNIEYGEAGQVAGMQDHVSISKAQFSFFPEPLVRFDKMCVRKDADGNHFYKIKILL